MKFFIKIVIRIFVKIFKQKSDFEKGFPLSNYSVSFFRQQFGAVWAN